MKSRTVVGVVAACLLAAACNATTDGIATVTSSTASSQTTALPTTLAGVSLPTTAAPNPKVTGTTFDGCASVTDAEATSWGLNLSSKTDTKDRSTLGAEDVRGCLWDGDKWQVRVYAINGSLSLWERPSPNFDRKTQVQFGTRPGWLAHGSHIPDCTAVVASEQGLAGVQVLPDRALQLDHTDVCPIAQQIMNTILPRIP
ncbi:DUF3558 family protein [Mycobacteroides salmoniphilum]|uniref:DUF3558 family protein n=1 Tax=Mycobacteroides salmoniphilum TaxID=404941 RepID=UPI001066F52C|nr:DUF3558 family protein [Mycobacteroides salmoniphilum]TDZ81208.1 hypothetical protein DE4586_01155 [Mycobacteroides salmoniphilum]TDZ88708.1 hypothetical protein DE4587_01071 [Mycobacteroides salmoniphilum]